MPRDFAVTGAYEFHQRTLNMPAPLSCHFSCKKCGDFKSTRGSKMIAFDGYPKRKVCAGCAEKIAKEKANRQPPNDL